MCEKCIDLDKKIQRYKSMQSRIMDELVLNSIAELIAELLTKKAELHPDQKE